MLAEWLEALDDDARAAILEFDGGLEAQRLTQLYLDRK